MIVKVFSLFLILSLANAKSFSKFFTKPDFIKGDVANFYEKNSNIVTDYAGKWDGGIVPYRINDIFTKDQKDLIIQSLKRIEGQTNNCIKFVEMSPHQSYVSWLHFVSDNGCWSWIGRGKNEQWLSLAPGCMIYSTIIHEILHALGFWHEQSRPDRDNFITVNWSNVMNGYESEFYSRADSIDTMETVYDYYSIMHYEYNTFAINRNIPTLIPKDISIDIYKMGKRDDLSDIDILKIKKYYECY